MWGNGVEVDALRRLHVVGDEVSLGVGQLGASSVRFTPEARCAP